MPVPFVFLAAIALATSEPTPALSYAGRWTLDLAATRNAPAYYAQIRSQTLHVVQDDSTVREEVVITHATGTADTMHIRYFLDGRTVADSTAMRAPGGMRMVPTRTRATIAADGTMHVTIARTLPMPTGTFEAQSVERFVLSADRRTLTVERDDQMPQGRVRWDMVFRRE